MIGFRLDGQRLAQTRFALPRMAELMNALEVLVHPGRAPYTRHWVAEAARRVDRGRIGTLLALAEEATWYVPDFLVPIPRNYEPSVDDELDAVSSTPSDRVRDELGLAFRYGPTQTDSPVLTSVIAATGDPRRPLPRAVATIIDRHGEEGLVRRLAGQLHHLWQAEMAALWPAVRAVNDADVRDRAFEAGKQGFDRVLELLDPELVWSGIRLGLQRPFDVMFEPSAGLVLTPSSFLPKPAVWFGPGQVAMVGYPARRRGQVWPRAGAAGVTTDVLGDAWGRLLADVGVPRSTGELAERLRLAPSTVSYHLTRLHRAGLVDRQRHGRRVLYERTQRAAETMRALGLDLN